MGIFNCKSSIGMCAGISKRGFKDVTLCFSLFWLSMTSLMAHPFTYSICKLYIGDQYISGNLEVSAENLIFFDYLKVDSTIYFSSEEILNAAKEYLPSLSESLVINSSERSLTIEDFKLEDFSDKGELTISNLKETFIHYSFKIKLNEAIDHLDFTHKIGAAYPLISSLLILEIEGKEVNRSFDNLATNKSYKVTFNKERRDNSTHMILEKGEKKSIVKIFTTYEFLRNAVGGVEKLEKDNDLLSNILLIKNGGFEISFSRIDINKLTENTILISAEIQNENTDDLLLVWQKFNMEVKRIPTQIISDEEKIELVLSRYDRSVNLFSRGRY